MRLDLHPQRRDDTLELVKSGDSLTINGETFDFSALADGQTLPAEAIACDLIAGPVSRVDGELLVSLILPLAINAPEAARFPAPLLDVADGVVDLPETSAPDAPPPEDPDEPEEPGE